MWRLGLLAFLGCNGGGSTSVDGAPYDAELLADAPLRDAVTPLTEVDVTVSGCAVYDPAGPSCHGTPPLSLRFAAIANAPLDRWLWDLGVGPPSTEATPERQYLVPGAYTVTLSAGGPGGTSMVVKEMFVRLDPAPVGSLCTPGVCASDLECVCGGEPTCPASLQGGYCARACNAATCGEGAVCADLSPAGPPAATGWRRDLCLRECDDDDDCAPYRCRELRAASGDGWVRGCFVADLLLDDGAACRDGAGDLDHLRCASGRCLGLGARGLCAGVCGTCASHAACATISALGPACLARCADAACDGDPWLDCEAPNPSGPMGFTVTEAAAPAGYCAPARCSGPSECPGGTCPDGFCAAP